MKWMKWKRSQTRCSNNCQGSSRARGQGPIGLPIGEGARMGTAGFSRLPQASMRSYLLLQCSVEGIAKLSLFVGCLIGLFSIENAS